MEKTRRINNSFYDSLDSMWHEAEDHPIALLRAENATRNPWILQTIQEHKKASCSILDIGCGGGLLSNVLARQGHSVTGIDLSKGSLEVAREENSGALFLEADATALPMPDQSFDVVCAMDLLEHVENPLLVIQEAARVLKPNGLFFFHTFNRNLLSYIIIIKGVEWFVKNAPKDMHVYSLFIKPKELTGMMLENNLSVETLQGLIPDARTKAFWKMLISRRVSPNFRFRFCKGLQTGYVGYASKKA